MFFQLAYASFDTTQFTQYDLTWTNTIRNPITLRFQSIKNEGKT
jgi:hypothetical protein